MSIILFYLFFFFAGHEARDFIAKEFWTNYVRKKRQKGKKGKEKKSKKKKKKKLLEACKPLNIIHPTN